MKIGQKYLNTAKVKGQKRDKNNVKKRVKSQKYQNYYTKIEVKILNLQQLKKSSRGSTVLTSTKGAANIDSPGLPPQSYSIDKPHNNLYTMSPRFEVVRI